MIAIALSMTVMIIATATVTGFKHSISDKIFGFWGHIHITSNYSPSSYAFESSPLQLNQSYYPFVDTIRQVQYNRAVNDWPTTFLEQLSQLDLGIALCLFVLSVVVLLLLNFKAQKPTKLWKYSNYFVLTASMIFILFYPYEIVQKEARFFSKGGIRHIQQFIQKEGIIKTADQIEGIVLRGVGQDYDWDYLKSYLKEGSVLPNKDSGNLHSILISETTARRLKLRLEDQFLIYFVQDGNSLARKFKICGIYKTGLEEYDKRFALIPIGVLQDLNNWRPYHSFGNELDLEEEQLGIRALTAYTAENDGGWNYVQQNFKEGQLLSFDSAELDHVVIPHQIAFSRQLKVGDSLHLNYKDNSIQEHKLPLFVKGIYQAPEDPQIKPTLFVDWRYLDQLNELLPAQVSGFEIFIDHLDDLEAFGNYSNYVLLINKEQYASTIKEIQTNIFDWLNLTDMNERIILLLMILVSIINMTTSLMILILERTNMIGILKALGARDWTIRKIFLYNAAYIIGYGLLWGNMIGIGLCLLQLNFGIITLPEDLYYVSVAPVELNLWTILLLNIGTMLITLAVLIIPSWLVAKIDPVKAIRFS